MTDYSADVQAYIDGVLSGEIVASRPVRLAVKRHVADLKDAGERGFYFDDEAASRVIEIIERCCVHTKNSISARAGDPLVLSASQKFIVWVLFGWKRKSDGMRRFSKALIEVAKKWGKSTFAAAIALIMLVADDPIEMSAEVYAVATKEKQAQIVFGEAKAMARRSPSFRKRLKVQSNAINCLATDGFFHRIGSDSDTTDGLNSSCIIMDEIHKWMKHHRELYGTLTTSGASRLQPLFLSITTAGDDRSELWKEERQYAVRCVESVLTGQVVDDTVFAFIACIDNEPYTCIECLGEGCDWCDDGHVEADDRFDEEAWKKAQPNLGVSVPMSWYHEKANEAREKPTAMNWFLRYCCNVMVSSSMKPIDPVLWSNCCGPADVEAGAYCCGAFDLGRSDDFAAWALTFPEEQGDDILYRVKTKSYTCEEHAKSIDNSEFRRWEEQGLIEVHPGDQIDLTCMESDIVELSGKYHVRSWAFDPQFAMQMSQNLLNVHGIECFKFTQSYGHYNESVRELLRLVKKGLIAHGGDELLAWQAGNLIIRKDPRDLWMPDKVNSEGKIDAMVSLIMGLSECMFHAGDPTPGEFYETNEVEFA